MIWACYQCSMVFALVEMLLTFLQPHGCVHFQFTAGISLISM